MAFKDKARRIDRDIKNSIASHMDIATANVVTGGRYDNSDGDRGVIPSIVTSLVGRIGGTADDLRRVNYDVYSFMNNLDVKTFCNFNDLMGALMSRLMQININEKDVTLSTLGQYAVQNGDSRIITANVLRPTYADGRNYLDFVDRVNMSDGNEITTRSTDNVDIRNTANGNELYRRTQNLFPDDNDTGAFGNRWNVSNHRNSILYKTKRLFAQGKINTLISRFGTNADPLSIPLDYTGRKGSTLGGESRGRNLLAKNPAKNYNGYNDPYCRVWTHHHQYNRVDRLIRPFQSEDNATTLEDMHSFPPVHLKDNDPKSSIFDSKGWRYSVLSNDKDSNYSGFVNITPKFLGGADRNIHTKQCMFSIENLAWRGYNPYEFENALSWEQRGPLGGRIMWFPPYGISFNETTTANWSSNTFIGRGEDVYTYINTNRTGSLSFILLVDHPSVLDYVSWHDSGRKMWGENQTSEASNGVTDEDLLQFFAGCDTANPKDPSSIFYKQKATPLTDEYKENIVWGETVDVEIKPEVVKSEEEPKVEQSPPQKVEFYIFYPNNYSGVYDFPTNYGNHNTGVDAVMYLMCGRGAQQENNVDIPIGVGDSVVNNVVNNGYEMTNKPIYDERSYIMGASVPSWLPYTSSYKDKSGKRRKKTVERQTYTDYKPTGSSDIDKKWFYRIDGYKVPKGDTDGVYLVPKGEEVYINQLCQTLCSTKEHIEANGNPYEDTKSYQLNSKVENVKELAFTEEAGNDDLFSASNVIASVLLGQNKVVPFNEYDGTVVEEVTNRLNSGKVVKIKACGFSSKDGANNDESVNASRNKNLAENRAKTITRWLKQFDVFKDAEVECSSVPGEAQQKQCGQRENSIESKAYRSALVTIEISTEETSALSKGSTDTANTNTTSEATTKKAEDVVADKSLENDAKKEQLTSAIKSLNDYIDKYGIEFLTGMLPNSGFFLGFPEVNITSILRELNREIDIANKWLEDPSAYTYVITDVVSMLNSLRELYLGVAENNTEEVIQQKIRDTQYLLNIDWGLKDSLSAATRYKVNCIERLALYEKALEIKKLENEIAQNEEEISNAESTIAKADNAQPNTDISDPNNAKQAEQAERGHKDERSVEYNEIFDASGKQYQPRRFKDSNGGTWVASKVDKDGTITQLQRIDMVTVPRFHDYDDKNDKTKDESNNYRYDQEYYFFRQLKREDPLVFQRLMDKLKYFDPAFHSMTPEGFNARLTFLHQCMRQGNTITMSDRNGQTANNLAFGRPPFCVLRLGDFLNQTILINNINLDYSVSDGLQWDLNPEGVGVQPMLCRVTMGITLIGGGDLAGPIRRLQNAMSFNYYANARLYDNRADRVMYNSEGDAKLEGALDWDVNTESSYAYSAAMYNGKDKDQQIGEEAHLREVLKKGVPGLTVEKLPTNPTGLPTTNLTGVNLPE